MRYETNATPYVSYNRIPTIVETYHGKEKFSSLKKAFEEVSKRGTITTVANRKLDTYGKFQKFMRNLRCGIVFVGMEVVEFSKHY